MTDKDGKIPHKITRRGSGRRLGARAAAACLSMLILSGCAVKQAVNDDPRDPWEGYNRHVFAFNESVDAVVLKPVASAYHVVLPEFARNGIANVFSNIGDLPSALNNLLQGDLSGGGSDVLRFLTNSTLGVLGVFDPASMIGLIKQEEDFGQTLGVWGVAPGPYFMLPLFGPSSVRDFPGKVVDFLIYPVNLAGDSSVRTAMQVTKIVSDREGFFEQEEILRELSPDLYQQLRGFYLDRRKHKVEDGAVSVDDELYEDLLE